MVQVQTFNYIENVVPGLSVLSFRLDNGYSVSMTQGESASGEWVSDAQANGPDVVNSANGRIVQRGKITARKSAGCDDGEFRIGPIEFLMRNRDRDAMIASLGEDRGAVWFYEDHVLFCGRTGAVHLPYFQA